MDRKYLDDRLRELGIYSEYYHRLELKPLASVLPYDDKLNCIFTGYWDGVSLPDPGPDNTGRKSFPADR